MLFTYMVALRILWQAYLDVAVLRRTCHGEQSLMCRPRIWPHIDELEDANKGADRTCCSFGAGMGWLCDAKIGMTAFSKGVETFQVCL